MCGVAKICVQRPKKGDFLDFGLFEFVAAFGIAGLARNAHARNASEIAFILASIFLPVILVFTIENESQVDSRMYVCYSVGDGPAIAPWSAVECVSSSADTMRDIVHAAARYVGRYVGRVNINGKCRPGPDHFPFPGRRDSAQATVLIEDALFRFSMATVKATPEISGKLELRREVMNEGTESTLFRTAASV